MKSPLSYQRTEFDCGPTSILNAICYLCERDSIPPEVIRMVIDCTLDVYNDQGQYGRLGTSQLSMNYISQCLNQQSAYKLPLITKHISGDLVTLSTTSMIITALESGGVVIVRLRYFGEHYVLITGISDDVVELFDPYYMPNYSADVPYQISDNGRCNRKVPLKVMQTEGIEPYNMLPAANRDALLFFKSDNDFVARR